MGMGVEATLYCHLGFIPSSLPMPTCSSISHPVGRMVEAPISPMPSSFQDTPCDDSDDKDKERTRKKKIFHENKCISFQWCYFIHHNQESNKSNTLVMKMQLEAKSPRCHFHLDGSSMTLLQGKAAAPTPEQLSKTAGPCTSLPYFKCLTITHSLCSIVCSLTSNKTTTVIVMAANTQ